MGAKRMLTPEEHAKVLRALDCLQKAQSILGAACQQLWSIRGFSDTWNRTCRLHDAIKAQGKAADLDDRQIGELA